MLGHRQPPTLSRRARRRRALDAEIDRNLAIIASERDCPTCGNGSVCTTAGCITCGGRGRVPRETS